MPKPYSLDLRERVVGFVEDGHSRRAAAAHFKVSVSFVVNLVKAVRRGEASSPSRAAVDATPSLNRIGRFFWRRSPRRPTSPCRNWRPGSPRRPARRLTPLRCRVGSFAPATGSKKTLRASEHDRPDINQAREEWTGVRQPRMRLEPHRLVFLDETGTTTKMTRLRGRCPKGQRLLSKVPFGHWKTQTFIAGLRCGALTAPFVIDAPMDRRIFETYVETQLAPTLNPAISSSWTICPPIKARPPRRPSAPRALGSSSCRPIAPTSIQSRWLSPSSRPCCAPGRSAPSTPSGAPSAKSAISSVPRMPKLLRRRRLRIHMKVRCSRS